jgi:hypothetical protein
MPLRIPINASGHKYISHFHFSATFRTLLSFAFTHDSTPSFEFFNIFVESSPSFSCSNRAYRDFVVFFHIIKTVRKSLPESCVNDLTIEEKEQVFHIRPKKFLGKRSVQLDSESSQKPSWTTGWPGKNKLLVGSEV